MSYIDKLSDVMSFSVRKRDAISNNISNQMTPDYKAQVVSWNETLQGGSSSELKTTDKGHMLLNPSGQNFTVDRDTTSKVNSDGNNVDMNKEIVEMMKNNQVFSISLLAMNKYYEASGAARGN